MHSGLLTAIDRVHSGLLTAIDRVHSGLLTGSDKGGQLASDPASQRPSDPARVTRREKESEEDQRVSSFGANTLQVSCP